MEATALTTDGTSQIHALSVNRERPGKKSKNKKGDGKFKSKIPVAVRKIPSMSEVTIYENAVKDSTKRVSSSSEDHDTSDEIMSGFLIDNMDEQLIDQFIAGQGREFDRARDVRDQSHQEPRPTMSNFRGSPSAAQGGPPKPVAQDITAETIRKAEASKARIYETPGEFEAHEGVQQLVCQVPSLKIDLNNDMMHSVMVDENYLMLGNHVDNLTRQKIIQGEYVDFSKLLPKDRVMSMEEGQHMEILNKEGQMFWVPTSDVTKISNFSKWEQAFRIFENIYAKAHPARATELVQYNHLIHTASLTYVWDNVYCYDMDFRLHLAMFPKRSWAIILQQVWSLRLKDRLRYNEGGNRLHKNVNFTPSKHDDGWGNLCKRFN